MFGEGATYDIGINLHKVGDGWDDLSAGVGAFTSAIDGAIGKVASLSAYAATGALGAGIAGLTWGVQSLNAEAEKAQISIGTIFSANGMATDVPSGIKLAGETIAKMRIDAQKLPGEFDDLRNIFATGAISAFHAGATVDLWRQVSAKAMAASAVAGLPMDQAARELAQLMEGRSGSHNVLGMRLMGLGGEKAEAFNKLDAGTRMDQISASLDKYSGAIDAFSTSYEGVSSTFIDNVKNFARLATSPLFDAIKGTLGDINQWFSANQGQVEHWTNRIGIGLYDAFQWGKAEILEWGPLVVDFAETSFHRLEDIWKDIQPAVQSFGDALRHALEDPNGTIDKLVFLGKLYAGLKVGGALIDGVGAVGKVASGVGGVASGAGGAMGAFGTAATPYALAAAPAAAVAGGLYYGAFGGVKTQVEHDDDDTKRGIGMADKAWDDAVKAGLSTTDVMRQSRDEIAFMNANFQSVTAAAYQAEMALLTLAHIKEVSGPGATFDAAKINEENQLAGFTALLRAQMTPAKAEREVDSGAKKKMPQMRGGHGGTSIQKVEIVVTSNQNPSRIALAVHAQLAGLSTNKRYSPDVPNYSAPDEGR